MAGSARSSAWVDADATRAATDATARAPGWSSPVEADVEAVEAVSEILGRVAPGGTSVEPAFELVDEGLGARVDPTRPAIVRAYVPGPRPRRPPNGPPPRSRTRSVTSRPSGCGRSASYGRGSSTRPTGPMPGRRTSRSCASAAGWSSGRPGGATGAAPDDVVLALDPGMAFGTGLHPTTRLCLAAIEALADAACSTARASSTSAAARGSWPSPRSSSGAASGARRRHRPDRRRGDPRERPPQPARPAPRAHARAACRAASRRSTSSSRTSSRACWCRSPPALHAELRPGGTLLASGIFVDREAEVAAAFEAAGLRGRRAPSRGRLGRAGGRPPGLTAAAALQSARDALVLPVPARRAHHPGGQPVPARRSCCPSRCGRSARRSSRGARSSSWLLWAQTHGTIAIGLGLALTGLGPGRVARLPRCCSSRGCSWR